MPDATNLPSLLRTAIASGDITDALRAILPVFDCVAGTIHLLNPETGLLELKAHHNLPPSITELVKIVPIGKGIAGAAAEKKEPVSICNLQTDSSGTARPSAKSTGMEGSLAVPMLKDGALFGVIGIAKARAHDWSEEETSLLLRIGEEISGQIVHHS